MASGDVVKTLGSAEYEIGKITAFSHENASTDKYLHCDGSEVSRTTYSKLYAVIGDTYGAGDGSTTFNLPDLRGEFLRGHDDGRGVDTGRALGSNQTDEYKKHKHYISNSDGTDYSNMSAAGNYSERNDGGTNGSIGFYDYGNTNTYFRPDESRSYRAIETFGGDETRPRNIAVKFYIRYEG